MKRSDHGRTELLKLLLLSPSLKLSMDLATTNTLAPPCHTLFNFTFVVWRLVI
eukprot:m.58228 g.58228  ORF g.58228 m.58228 type:complete len:53 (-) comp11665_c1_seq1:1338-1496(-)